MNDLARLLKKNPALVIGTAAVVGLALGTGVLPVPIRGLRPAAKPAASTTPATPPPPPDPIDAY